GGTRSVADTGGSIASSTASAASSTASTANAGVAAEAEPDGEPRTVPHSDPDPDTVEDDELSAPTPPLVDEPDAPLVPEVAPDELPRALTLPTLVARLRTVVADPDAAMPRRRAAARQLARLAAAKVPGAHP